MPLIRGTPLKKGHCRDPAIDPDLTDSSPPQEKESQTDVIDREPIQDLHILQGYRLQVWQLL